jgi:hypothetical protein
MTQKRFSPKDAKIIRDNPGKSPGELTALGLSKAAYGRLVTQPPVSIDTPIQPVKIEHAALPAKATGRTPNHVVRLLNKATQVIVELGFRAASSLCKHNPNQYQILS